MRKNPQSIINKHPQLQCLFYGKNADGLPPNQPLNLAASAASINIKEVSLSTLSSKRKKTLILSLSNPNIQRYKKTIQKLASAGFRILATYVDEKNNLYFLKKWSSITSRKAITLPQTPEYYKEVTEYLAVSRDEIYILDQIALSSIQRILAEKPPLPQCNSIYIAKQKVTFEQLKNIRELAEFLITEDALIAVMKLLALLLPDTVFTPLILSWKACADTLGGEVQQVLDILSGTITLEKADPNYVRWGNFYTMYARRVIKTPLDNPQQHIVCFEKQRTNIKLRRPLKVTALDTAVIKGELATVKSLLPEESANIKWDSLLHSAAKNGRLDVLKFLLEKKPKTNDNHDDREACDTILHSAGDYAHIEIVKYLLSNGHSIDEEGEEEYTLLHLAAKNGDLTLLNYLIDSGANIEHLSGYENTPIFLAAQNGHIATVKRLCEANADFDEINHADETPLILAAKNGHIQIVKYLLGKGAECDYKPDDGETALCAADNNNQPEIVKLLLEESPTVNAEGGDKSPFLIIAASHGCTNIVNALISKGAEVNHKDEGQDTALTLAALNGHTDTVKVLISKGAEVNHKNEDQDTALILAALNGHTDTIKVLISKGAEVNHQNKSQNTALSLAAWYGYLDTIKVLTNHGANSTYQALLHAATQDYSDIVLHLMPAAVKLTHWSRPTLKQDNMQSALLMMLANLRPGFSQIPVLNTKRGNTAQEVAKHHSTNLREPSTLACRRASTALLFTKTPTAKSVGMPRYEHQLYIAKPYLPGTIFSTAPSKKSSEFEMQVTACVLNKTNVLAAKNLRTLIGSYSPISKNGRIHLIVNTPGYIFSIAGKKITPNTLTPAQLGTLKQENAARTHIYYTQPLKAHIPTRLYITHPTDKLTGFISTLPANTIVKQYDDGYIVCTPENHNAEFVISTQHKHHRILDDFSILNSTYPGIAQLIIEEKKIQKSCRAHAVDFYTAFATKYPEKIDCIRLNNIDNNHVNISIKTMHADGASWTPVELGGEPARLKYTNSTNTHNASRALAQRQEKIISTTAWQRITQYAHTAFQTLAVPAESLSSLVLNKKYKSQCLIHNTPNTLAAHTLHLLGEKKMPTFHLTRSMLEKGNKKMLVMGEAVDGTLAYLRDNPFKIFLNTLSSNPATLVINWFELPIKKRAQLNSLLDTPPSFGEKIYPNLRVISIMRKNSTDPSFTTRHQVTVNIVNAFKPLTSNSSSTRVTIDCYANLQLTDLLFGEFYTDSGVVHYRDNGLLTQALREAVPPTSISLKNLPMEHQKAFKARIEIALARGYIEHHGKKITIPSGLHISIDPSPLNFSHFDPISITRITDPTTCPNTVHVTNTYLFGQLIKKPYATETGDYLGIPGLLMDGITRDVQLYITQPLSESQSYMLYHLTQGKRLHCYLAPGVKAPGPKTLIPIESALDPLPANDDLVMTDADETATTPSKKAQLFCCKDPETYLKQYESASNTYIIDIDDLGFQDLFNKNHYTKTQNADNTVHFSSTARLSELGEILCRHPKAHIILTGTFSTTLLAALTPLLLKGVLEVNQKTLTIQAQLSLVVANEECLKTSFPYLPDEQVHDVSEAVLNEIAATDSGVSAGAAAAASAGSSSVMTSPERKAFLYQESPNTVYSSASDFIAQRKAHLFDGLRHAPIAKLVGPTGVGKSSLIHEIAKETDNIVYRDFDQLAAWGADNSEQRKILFIDESNLKQKHLTQLSPVMRNGKRQIYYNDKFHTLSDNHCVVVACNPNTYRNRFKGQALFERFKKLPELHLAQFPKSYIKEYILAPIPGLSEADKNKLINRYQSERAKRGEVITVRLLQQWAYEKRHALASESSVSTAASASAGANVSPVLFSAPSTALKKTHLTVTQLSCAQKIKQFLDIQKEKDNPRPPFGLNALHVSGTSGSGKGEVIKATLADCRYRKNKDYIHLSASLLPNTLLSELERAYATGKVVWIDEINTCLLQSQDDNRNLLEKTLNQMLTGDYTLPETYGDLAISGPGFGLITTGNAAYLEGRSIMSKALKARASSVTLATPTAAEICTIATSKHLQLIDSILLTQCLSVTRASRFALVNTVINAHPGGSVGIIRHLEHSLMLILKESLPDYLYVLRHKINTRSNQAERQTALAEAKIFTNQLLKHLDRTPDIGERETVNALQNQLRQLCSEIDLMKKPEGREPAKKRRIAHQDERPNPSKRERTAAVAATATEIAGETSQARNTSGP